LERLSDEARGYAVIRAVGVEPTRLIDRCAAEGIDFWGVYPEDDFTFIFKTRLRYADAIMGFAEKCCCETEILERRGLPIEGKKLRRRQVLWLLPLILLSLLVASSFFVWKIEITGNEQVSEIEILNALEDSGVAIGSYWPNFTSDNIRSCVLVKIPELKWISVSVFGSRVYVEVRERTDIPDIYDETEPIKLVAVEPGIIESVSVLRGYSLFKKGQTAAENDTLVTGAVPSTFGETEILHAQGSVFARTWYEISAVMPLNYEKKIFTGEKKSRFALIVGEERINFYAKSRIFDKDCDNIINERRLGIKGFFELPIIWVKETAEPYELSSGTISEQEAKTQLEAFVNTELKTRIGKDGEVKSAEYSFSVVNGYAVGTLRAECVQNIAAEKDMSADEISAAKSTGKDSSTR